MLHFSIGRKSSIYGREVWTHPQRRRLFLPVNIEVEMKLDSVIKTCSLEKNIPEVHLNIYPVGL